MVDNDANSSAAETWLSTEEEYLAVERGLLNTLFGRLSLYLS